MSELLQVGGLAFAFRAEGATYVWGDVARQLDAGAEFPIAFGALALHNRGRRDGEMQLMQRNNTYRQFESAGIPVTALDREDTDQTLPAYSERDLERINAFAREKGVVATLEEYPMRGGLLGLLTQLDPKGLPPVIVNAYRSGHNKTETDIANLQDGLASGVVAAVTVDAHASKAAYVERGVSDGAITVIPNGIDTGRFRPSAEGRAAVRSERGIGADDPVVLLIARDSPEKDIPLFLDSAARYLRANRDSHVIMAGAGLSYQDNESLRQQIDTQFQGDQSLQARLHTLGQRPDLPALYAASDVLALTSQTESRPLSVTEAYASGIKVVVATEVGDVPIMVGDNGFITGRNPEEIADKWQEAYERRHEIGFDIARRDDLGLMPMVRRYARVIIKAA